MWESDREEAPLEPVTSVRRWISAQGAQGTFSGEGVCLTPEAAVEPLAVSSDQFDILIST